MCIYIFSLNLSLTTFIIVRGINNALLLSMNNKFLPYLNAFGLYFVVSKKIGPSTIVVVDNGWDCFFFSYHKYVTKEGTKYPYFGVD